MLRRFFLICCCVLLLPAVGSADSLQLIIKGGEGELRQVLEKALVLPSALQNGDQLNTRWLRHYQRQLPTLVNDVLEPYGYFYSRTSSRVEQDDAGTSLLVVEVNPGDALRITSLDLELTGPGAALPELRTALNDFPLRKGDILRQDYYEQGKAVLKQSAVDLGFLDADFSRHQIRVHRGEQRADVILEFDSGIRYRFGPTHFSGIGTYPERFVRRFLAYREGEVFSYSLLGRTQLNLLNADLFRTVNIAPQPELKKGQRMPILIEMEPAPRHRLRPGIGYGTDTGARVSLSYRNLNLFERGHELKGELLLAEKKQSLVTTYIIPDLDRLDSQTLLRVGVDREETDSYLSRTLFSEAEYQRSLLQDLIGSLFVRLSQEYSRIGEERTRAQMLLPGMRFNWRRVDDPLVPRRGIQLNLEVLGAQETLFSDTSLLQAKAQATGLLPLPREFSLLLRLQGGNTWHDDPLRELPASLRFFAGGDRSVRGFAYQSLGPRNDQGEVVGGKNLLVANVELERRFSEKWGGAIFYDIGNAFDSFAEYELEQGAGIGVRRYTPIGPLRLDLARQIGNDKNKYRLHLSVGFGW